jgi:hypothetical protein
VASVADIVGRVMSQAQAVVSNVSGLINAAD